MRRAFATAVGTFKPVPVTGHPGGDHYVIELDVDPKDAECGDLVFGYCPRQTEPVTIIRQNNKSVRREAFDGEFMPAVRQHMEDRRRIDLQVTFQLFLPVNCR